MFPNLFPCVYIMILSLFGFLKVFFFIGVEVLEGRELSSTLKLFTEQQSDDNDKSSIIAVLKFGRSHFKQCHE